MQCLRGSTWNSWLLSALDDVTRNEHSGTSVSEEKGSAGVKDTDPLSGNIDTVLLSPHFNLVDSMVSAGPGCE
ncbi:hypothetical protein MRX96_000459 [Rhipicephalus microplus]